METLNFDSFGINKTTLKASLSHPKWLSIQGFDELKFWQTLKDYNYVAENQNCQQKK